jgi:hypothetical protein
VSIKGGIKAVHGVCIEAFVSKPFVDIECVKVD